MSSSRMIRAAPPDTTKRASQTTGNARSAIVYDGACGFCQRQIARIRRGDPHGQFDYVPSQSPELLVRFPALTGQQLSSGLRLVEPGGEVHVGADATYQIARRLRGWRWIAWLYRVPGVHWLARRAYAWIARNRYRLAGRSACPGNACDVNRTLRPPAIRPPPRNRSGRAGESAEDENLEQSEAGKN